MWPLLVPTFCHPGTPLNTVMSETGSVEKKPELSLTYSLYVFFMAINYVAHLRVKIDKGLRRSIYLCVISRLPQSHR